MNVVDVGAEDEGLDFQRLVAFGNGRRHLSSGIDDAMYWPFSISKPLVCCSLATSSSVSLSMKTRLTRFSRRLVDRVERDAVGRGGRGVEGHTERHLSDLMKPFHWARWPTMTHTPNHLIGDSSIERVIRSLPKRIIFNGLSRHLKKMIQVETFTVGWGAVGTRLATMHPFARSNVELKWQMRGGLP